MNFMEIMVQGRSESFYMPNQVTLNLSFVVKEYTYDKVLEKGSANVLDFIHEILLPQGFKEEDLKTNHFSIQRETKYNEHTETYDFIGYSYNQNAVLKFDYDKDRLSTIMVAISKMENPPFYEINFTLKDINACKEENLTKAFKDAEKQAYVIAQAANKKLKYCAKTDFQPFTTEAIAKGYDSDIVQFAKSIDTINTVFTPEDIQIRETLYCLWIAD